jgi:hypothetical protein
VLVDCGHYFIKIRHPCGQNGLGTLQSKCFGALQR